MAGFEIETKPGTAGASSNDASCADRFGCLVSLHKSDLVEKNDESAMSGLLNGVLDGAYRQPAKAIKQLVGKDSGETSAQDPLKTESGSHKVGEIIGSLVPFIAVGIATRGASVRMFGEQAAPTLLRTMGEQAVTGFVMGSVLTPTLLKPGGNLWAERLKQGGTSAATFATMAATGKALDRYLPTSATMTLLPTITRRMTVATLSGAVGGVVDIELKTGFHASGKDVLTSAGGYAAFGGIMEAGGMITQSLLAPPRPAGLGESPQGKDAVTSDKTGDAATAKAEQSDEMSSVARRFISGESAVDHSDKAPIDRAVPSDKAPIDRVAPSDKAPIERAAPSDKGPIDRVAPSDKAPIERAAPSDKGPIDRAAPSDKAPIERVAPSDKSPIDRAAPSDKAPIDRVAPSDKAPIDRATPPDRAQIENSRGSQLDNAKAESADRAPNPPKDGDVGAVLNPLGQESRPIAREQLLGEFKNFKGGIKGDLEGFALYDELIKSDILTDAQKVRLTDVLSDVRDYYANVNSSGHTHANRAQKSWLYSQSAIAEVIKDTLADVKDGGKPVGTEIESKILVALFSQFRMHKDIEYSEAVKSLGADRVTGAQTILSNVGYSQDHIDGIVKTLETTSLMLAPLDEVQYNEIEAQKLRPAQNEQTLARSPKLAAETPIQNNWKYPNGEETTLANGITVSHWNNRSDFGRLQRDGDTSLVTDDANNRSFRYDNSGKITEAQHVDTRKFEYDKFGKLNRIESSLFGNLERGKGGNWYSENGVDENGSIQKELIGQVKVIADDDGSVRLISSKTNEIRVYGLDGTATLHRAAGRPVIETANYQFEQDRLLEKIHDQFTDPDRLDRVTKLLRSFENESSARGLDKTEQALFYRQLNRLLADNPNSSLNALERRELAEQVLNHAAFPTTIDQGGNSTCNVTAIENRTYTRTPKDMANLVADIANNGIYTTSSGKRVDLGGSLTGLKPDAEARASMELQNEVGDVIKDDGGRDWASQLAQIAMVKIKHLTTTEFVARDTLDPDALVFDNQNKLIGKIPYKSIKWSSSADPADLVYDSDGDALGVITDKNKLTTLYDYFGKPVNELAPGSNYFDENGNLVLYQTIPGDITYDKILDKPKNAMTPAEEVERLQVQHLGNSFFLKEMDNGKATVMDSPNLNTSMYLSIANEVTGAEPGPFSIFRGNSYGDFATRTRISTLDELDQVLVRMKDDSNFPGIVRVHTRNFPFNHKIGGGHVVNIQDYDPQSQRVYFTNQWGSQYDYMDKGISLKAMFNAMADP